MYIYKIKLFIGVMVFVFSTSCHNTNQQNETKHYSEEMLKNFEKICAQQKSRTKGIYLIDSLYKTFPYISSVDKYGYYNFMQEVTTLVKYNERTYDTAISYLDSVITVIEQNGLQKKMRNQYIAAFNKRGDYYIKRHRYNYAIKDITKSKQLNEEGGDTCLMAENTKTLSMIAINQSNHMLAANLTKEALQLSASCKKNAEHYKRVQIYINDLGYIYSLEKKYDSALLYYFEAEKFVQENKALLEKDTIFSYDALENIYGNISYTYLLQKKYTQAEDYAKKALAIDVDILHDSLKMAMSQYIIATINFDAGKFNEADAMAQKAILKTNYFDIGMRADLWGIKAKIAKINKNYKEEANYRERWELSKDSMYMGRIEILKKNPFVEYEQIDKKYQVELLKKDNQNQRNKTNAAIVIGLLSILLAATFFYNLRKIRTLVKKLKQTMQQNQLQAKQKQEEQLYFQEIRLQMQHNEAILNQRKAISEDLHDDLSGSLIALRYYIDDLKQGASNDEEQKKLLNIREEVNSIYINARQYMHSLNESATISHYDLPLFLREMSIKFKENGSMNFETETSKDFQNELSMYQHDQLYFIVNESISNIIKHASATVIKVHINCTTQICNFLITDNGKGINTKNIIPNGLGIKSIKSRIKDLNGEIDWQINQQGTAVVGRFPIH